MYIPSGMPYSKKLHTGGWCSSRGDRDQAWEKLFFSGGAELGRLSKLLKGACYNSAENQHVHHFQK